MPLKDVITNQIFSMRIAASLDGVIMNALDPSIHDLILASEGLVGKDLFCMKYIGGYNKSRLKAICNRVCCIGHTTKNIF